MWERILQRFSRLSTIAGFATALAVAGIPLLLLEAQPTNQTVTRLGVTGNRISALHTDGNQRVLVIDSSSRADARAFPGRVSRPWSADVDLIIAPANDFAASGLIEAIERNPDAQVLVAGIPGADQNWLAIERAVEDGSLTYVDSIVSFELDRSHVTVTGDPAADSSRAGVLIRSNQGALFMNFGESPPPEFADVVITAGDPDEVTPITIRPPHLETIETSASNSVFTVERTGSATLVFDENAIRLRGDIRNAAGN